MKVGEFLRTLAPDFCWCTAFDLFLMMEQIDEDVQENAFYVYLAKEKQRGLFETKIGPSTKPRGKQSVQYYRRNSDYKFTRRRRSDAKMVPGRVYVERPRQTIRALRKEFSNSGRDRELHPINGSFEKEITKHYEGLRRFAIKLTKNEQEAQDLVQDVMLRALEKQHLFDGRKLWSWLSKIMYNMFVSEYRRKIKWETKFDPEDFIAKAIIPAPQHSAIAIGEILNRLQRLPADKAGIIADYALGLTYDEMAVKYKIPVGTVRSRLSRARAALAAKEFTSC